MPERKFKIEDEGQVSSISFFVSRRMLRAVRSFQRICILPQRHAMTATTMATNAGAEPAPKQAKIEAAPVLRVKKLSENAILPVRGSSGAAGYDLARYDDFP